MDDLTERASLAAMRLYGMGENECAKAMADCRKEIERLRAALESIHEVCAAPAENDDRAVRRWIEVVARNALMAQSN